MAELAAERVSMEHVNQEPNPELVLLLNKLLYNLCSTNDQYKGVFTPINQDCANFFGKRDISSL